MEYVDKIVDFVKVIGEFHPGNSNKTSSATKPSIRTGSFYSWNFRDSFGPGEWIACGCVALVLFIALVKYENHRFIRAVALKVRREVAQEVRNLLDEKLSEEFFESFLSQYTNQSHQGTQVEMPEFELTRDTSEIEERTSTLCTSPKTPRQSRIPIPQITAVRRSNSEGSPSKRKERGDPGVAIRGPNWERRNH